MELLLVRMAHIQSNSFYTLCSISSATELTAAAMHVCNLLKVFNGTDTYEMGRGGGERIQK